MGNGLRRVDESWPPSLTRYRPGNPTALCVEVPGVKSTFVTAPSFASSSSVTSINHVLHSPSPPFLLLSSSLWNSSFYPIRFLAYTRAPIISRSPPYFPLSSSFPFYQFLSFFLGRPYKCYPRGRAYYPRSAFIGQKWNFADLCHLYCILSALIIFYRAWWYVKNDNFVSQYEYHRLINYIYLWYNVSHKHDTNFIKFPLRKGTENIKIKSSCFKISAIYNISHIYI